MHNKKNTVNITLLLKVWARKKCGSRQMVEKKGISMYNETTTVKICYMRYKRGHQIRYMYCMCLRMCVCVCGTHWICVSWEIKIPIRDFVGFFSFSFLAHTSFTPHTLTHTNSLWTLKFRNHSVNALELVS